MLSQLFFMFSLLFFLFSLFCLFFSLFSSFFSLFSLLFSVYLLLFGHKLEQLFSSETHLCSHRHQCVGIHLVCFFVVLLTQLSSGISLHLIIFAWPTLTVTFYFLLCLADAYGHLYFLLCLTDDYGHLVFSSGFYLQTSCLLLFSMTLVVTFFF